MRVDRPVAVPVERALDYSLGQAYMCKHEWSEDLLLVLPAKFSSPWWTEAISSASLVGLRSLLLVSWMGYISETELAWVPIFFLSCHFTKHLLIFEMLYLVPD